MVRVRLVAAGQSVRRLPLHRAAVVFGTVDAWRDAPMLAGASPGELARLVDDVQTRWISFVHDGRQHAGAASGPRNPA